MATAKEIKTQVASIKSTQKITKAMQLVAASKIRKAQERMEESLPYSEKIRTVIGHVARSHSQFHHPFLKIHTDIKKVGLIVVSSDRGLCGGLNSNLFRAIMQEHLKEWHAKNVVTDLCLVGTKADVFFRHHDFEVVSHIDHIGDMPSIADLIGTIKVMLDSYYVGELQGLYIAHNEFINTMIQRPKMLQLLPLEVDTEKEPGRRYWDYIYEPDSRQLLDTLMRRYLEAQIYQAVIDNIACEQAARMVAMQSATDNAGQLMDDLQLIYNKARQSAITQEITEIVSGAAAV
ncbi:MAG: F0F1 ATP synthase subunit gamma [Gammaproteobacteria bacterium]|nr:F0F1 ATP synthase subunit gamma [Gammaproteobacteria bacterium]